MKNCPKLSVIIPVFNTAQYLDMCIDSVINQTLGDIEIICIDDGSTDKSLSILKHYAKKDPRIIVLKQPNSGQGAARNNALNIARGEYILFVDSDDLIRNDTCKNLFNNAHNNKLDMLMFSGYNFIGTPDNKQENRFWNFSYLSELRGTNIFGWSECSEFAHRMAVSTCLTMYRRLFILDNNLRFPEGLFFEDNLFFVRAITSSRRVSIDSAKYYIRRLHSNQTTQNWDKNFADYITITTMVLDYLSKIKVPNTVFNNYREMYLSACRGIYSKISPEYKEKHKSMLNQLLTKYGLKADKVYKYYLFGFIPLFSVTKH